MPAPPATIEQVEAAADVRAGLVVDDVIAKLRAAIGADGNLAFGAVGRFDDVASFRQTADSLATVAAGVIPGPIDERPGPSDDDTACRMELQVAIAGSSGRGPAEDESAAINKVRMAVAASRAALLADRSRGGLCHLIPWAGGIIRGTEIGATRTGPTRAGEAATVQIIPVLCAWIVPD